MSKAISQTLKRIKITQGIRLPKYITINYRFLFDKYSPLLLNQVFSPDFQKQLTGYLVGSISLSLNSTILVYVGCRKD